MHGFLRLSLSLSLSVALPVLSLAHTNATSVAAQDSDTQLSESEKTETAKRLFLEAESHAEVGEWSLAATKYEAAYRLVPEKHGFAYKIGIAAWKAENCDKAYEYLTHLVTFGGEDPKLADKIAEARSVLEEIKDSSCASNANKNDSTTSSANTESNDGGHDSESGPLNSDAAPVPDRIDSAEQAVDLDDVENPLGLSRRDMRSKAANEMLDSERAKHKGMLIAGITLSSTGALAIGGGLISYFLAKKTGDELAELSSLNTVTNFPQGDFSCRNKSEPCPYQLAGNLDIYNLITPIAYGVGGGLVAVGFILIGAQQAKVRKNRNAKKASLRLRGLSPVWMRSGLGASASIGF